MHMYSVAQYYHKTRMSKSVFVEQNKTRIWLNQIIVDLWIYENFTNRGFMVYKNPRWNSLLFGFFLCFFPNALLVPTFKVMMLLF